MREESANDSACAPDPESIDVDRLSGRQRQQIDCALCGGWLAFTLTRSLGEFRSEFNGRLYELWAHAAECPDEVTDEEVAAWWPKR
ncbi:hypothetical protein GCM10022245_46730 [Streptomyces mayteni]